MARVECPSCHALNADTQNYCHACGEALDPAAGAASAAARQARRAANRDLARVLRLARTLRGLFAVFALCSGLLFVLLVTSLAALGEFSGIARVAVIAFAIEPLLLGLGAWQVVRKPFPWAVGLAAYRSLLLVIGFAGGAYELSPFSLAGLLAWFGVALVVALWSVVPLTARAKKLLDEHPDLWIAGRMRGRYRKGAAVAEARRRRLRAALVGSASVLALAFGVLAIAWLDHAAKDAFAQHRFEPGPAPPPAAAIAAFRRAWNANDFERVGAIFSSSRMARRLPRLVERWGRTRGWNGRLPRLGPVEVPDDGSYRYVVRFPVASGGLIKTIWRYRDGRWCVVGWGPEDD